MLPNSSREDIIITCDDFCPKYIETFIIWEEIKKQIPDIKVNFFVTPFWMGKVHNHIDNEDFLNLWKSNQDWIEFHLHGYKHDYPPENKKDHEEQFNDMQKAFEIFKPYILNDYWGYRPPGWHMNDSTKLIIQQLGGAFLITDKSAASFYDGKEHLLNTFNTHANFHLPDSVCKISNYIIGLKNRYNFKKFSEVLK